MPTLVRPRLQKPYTPVKPKLGAPKAMTIAIGMLCAEGVVIAADQAVTTGYYAQTNQLKVDSGFGKNCSFALATSSDEQDAALVLQNRIVKALKNADPSSITAAEDIVLEQMSDWSIPWVSLPNIQLLIGFCGSDADPEEGGPVILHAKPPNTILRKRMHDDSKGYFAIGSGASVTNPLYSTLMPSICSAQKALSKIAYLMDKAKKGDAFCGGRTNAILVHHALGEPRWITPVDMETAERIAAHMDFYLQWTTSCFFGQTDEGVGQLVEGLATAIKQDTFLRNMQFRTMHGEKIVDTSVQAPSNP